MNRLPHNEIFLVWLRRLKEGWDRMIVVNLIWMLSVVFFRGLLNLLGLTLLDSIFNHADFVTPLTTSIQLSFMLLSIRFISRQLWYKRFPLKDYNPKDRSLKAYLWSGLTYLLLFFPLIILVQLILENGYSSFPFIRLLWTNPLLRWALIWIGFALFHGLINQSFIAAQYGARKSGLRSFKMFLQFPMQILAITLLQGLLLLISLLTLGLLPGPAGVMELKWSYLKALEDLEPEPEEKKVPEPTKA